MNPPSEPQTRSSLLGRIGDKTDQDAWNEFVEIYHPVVYRIARYKGLQDADAQDVVQQVLVSVGKTLAQRPHDSSRAKFRTWLSTVTRNATINALRVRQRHIKDGDSQTHLHLEQVMTSEDETLIEREYQKELFRRAARIIQPEFAADTWQAFWKTTVEQQTIADVGEQLGKQPGSVYAARSRVIRRLRQEVQRMQKDDE